MCQLHSPYEALKTDILDSGDKHTCRQYVDDRTNALDSHTANQIVDDNMFRINYQYITYKASNHKHLNDSSH